MKPYSYKVSQVIAEQLLADTFARAPEQLQLRLTAARLLRFVTPASRPFSAPAVRASSNCERQLCKAASSMLAGSSCARTHPYTIYIYGLKGSNQGSQSGTRTGKLARGHLSMEQGKAVRLRPVNLPPPLAASISLVVKPAAGTHMTSSKALSLGTCGQRWPGVKMQGAWLSN